MKRNPKLIRTIFLIANFITLTGVKVFSQETIEVKNTEAAMLKGTQPCYLVEIPKADIDFVKVNWSKKLQENNKVKVKETEGNLVFAGGVKTEIMTDTLTIYSLLFQKEESVVMNVFVERGNNFIAPDKLKADPEIDKIDNNIKIYIRRFAVNQYRLATSSELEGQQKILATMQSDLEKLEKNEDNLVKSNSSLEGDIDDAEKEASETDRNITQKNQEILALNTSMLTITGETEKKAAEDKKKQLDKEKNQLEKSRSKLKNDISSYKSKIEKNTKEIKESKELQEKKKEEIAAQNEVVSKVQVVLDGIK